MKSKKDGKPTTSGTCFSTFRGLLLSLLSGFLISTVTFLVKYVDNVSAGQLCVYRFWAISSFILPQLIFSGQKNIVPSVFRVSVIVLAIAFTTSIFLEFMALRYLPLGEAAVLVSCYPVLVSFAGRIFLKETFGLLQIVSLLITILGMMLTTGFYLTLIEGSRTYTTDDIYGLASGTASSFFGAMAYILARKLKDTDSGVLTLSIGIVGVIESAAITASEGSFSLSCTGSLQQGLIILLGFLSYLGSVAIVSAFHYAEAGPVSITRASSDILFSFMFQVIVFEDIPSGATVIGAILVLSSIILVGLKQKVDEFLPEKCAKMC